MAGIKSIQDLYKRVGEKQFREILAKETRITEKFDAYRFAFEKSQNDYQIYFYGKNGKIPLNKIDRTINDLYEDAIAYIENIPSEIKKAIPTKHRFGFSWFPNNAPLSTHYERRPKNGLVLTDITVRKNDSEIARDVKENKIFERWSNIFNCEWNKPLFIGNFNESSIEQLVSLAKADSNVSMINEDFFPVKGLLNEKHQNIEAIVFEQADLLFKIAEPIVEQKESRSHLFDILLLEICEYISGVNINQLSSHSKESDIAYIELVSELFNGYVSKKGDDFLKSDLNRPKFLEKSGSFNSSWIVNEKTKRLVESNERYAYLFTVFLANLRKPKYVSGLLSESIVTDFNNKIEEINNIIEGEYSFLEFNFILNEEEKEKKDDKEKDAKKEDSSRIEKAITVVETFFNPEKKLPKKETVVAVVCNCSLLSKKLVDYLEEIHNKTKKRIVLFHDTRRDFLHMDINNVKKILNVFVENRKKVFLEYHILDIPLVQVILDKCDNFVPEVIYCDAKHIDFFEMETKNLNAIYGEANYKWKFEKISNKLYKDAIEIIEIGSNEIEYQKSTVDEMHPYWYTVKSLFDSAFYV